MAVLDHAIPNTPNLFARFAQSFVSAIEAVMDAHSRAGQFAYYDSLSDDELGAKGLRREDIVLHIFRDQIC